MESALGDYLCETNDKTVVVTGCTRIFKTVLEITEREKVTVGLKMASSRRSVASYNTNGSLRSILGFTLFLYPTGNQIVNKTFLKLYRTLGRVTAGLLITAVTVFGLAICLALLGLRHPAESLDQVAKALSFLFTGMLGVFLVSSLVAAIVRLLDRRSRPIA